MTLVVPALLEWFGYANTQTQAAQCPYTLTLICWPSWPRVICGGPRTSRKLLEYSPTLIPSLQDPHSVWYPWLMLTRVSLLWADCISHSFHTLVLSVLINHSYWTGTLDCPIKIKSLYYIFHPFQLWGLINILFVSYPATQQVPGMRIFCGMVVGGKCLVQNAIPLQILQHISSSNQISGP